MSSLTSGDIFIYDSLGIAHPEIPDIVCKFLQGQAQEFFECDYTGQLKHHYILVGLFIQNPTYTLLFIIMTRALHKKIVSIVVFS